MPWIPIGHRVLIQPNEKYEVEITESGERFRKQGDIYIPETAAKRESYLWNRGTIKDWGPTAGRHFDDLTMEELGITRGDKVLYNEHVGLTLVGPDGVGYRVINDWDLNAVWCPSNLPEDDKPWQPIGFRIIVQPTDVKAELKKQYATVEVPESVIDDETFAWNQGTIKKYGATAGMHFNGLTMKELGIECGDKVLYNQYAGITFTENGASYRIVNDQDLNMVWREPEEKPIEEA